MMNRLFQHITVEESTNIQWVNLVQPLLSIITNGVDGIFILVGSWFIAALSWVEPILFQLISTVVLSWLNNIVSVDLNCSAILVGPILFQSISTVVPSWLNNIVSVDLNCSAVLVGPILFQLISTVVPSWLDQYCFS